MGFRQLPLWSRFPTDHAPPIDEPTYHCADCGKPMGQDEFAASLWGSCKECESDRLEDAWAG